MQVLTKFKNCEFHNRIHERHNMAVDIITQSRRLRASAGKRGRYSDHHWHVIRIEEEASALESTYVCS